MSNMAAEGILMWFEMAAKLVTFFVIALVLCAFCAGYWIGDLGLFKEVRDEQVK